MEIRKNSPAFKGIEMRCLKDGQVLRVKTEGDIGIYRNNDGNGGVHLLSHRFRGGKLDVDRIILVDSVDSHSVLKALGIGDLVINKVNSQGKILSKDSNITVSQFDNGVADIRSGKLRAPSIMNDSTVNISGKGILEGKKLLQSSLFVVGQASAKFTDVVKSAVTMSPALHAFSSARFTTENLCETKINSTYRGSSNICIGSMGTNNEITHCGSGDIEVKNYKPECSLKDKSAQYIEIKDDNVRLVTDQYCALEAGYRILPRNPEQIVHPRDNSGLKAFAAKNLNYLLKFLNN